MKISVLTFSLLQIIHFRNVVGTRISQERCDSYKNLAPATGDFPFMVRIYNGDYLTGALISEYFVLTIANNGTVTPTVTFRDIQRQFETIEQIRNQNIQLLRLSEAIEFNDKIQPVCLPQLQNMSEKLTEFGWFDKSTPDDKWFDEIVLQLTPQSICSAVHFSLNISIQGVRGIGEHFCTLIEKDVKCSKPGAVLLNDLQQAVGISAKCVNGSRQLFVRLSDYVTWIEEIVWPNSGQSTTTEKTFISPSGNDSTTIEKTTVLASLDADAATETTESTILHHIIEELHEVHQFLNINLVLIVIILFLVLAIAIIMWSDGFGVRRVRSVRPERRTTKTTSV